MQIPIYEIGERTVRKQSPEKMAVHRMMMTRLNEWVGTLVSAERTPLVLFGACTVLTLGTGYFLTSSLTWADEREYYTLAGNLFAHSIYSTNGHAPTAFRPPGYAFFLSWWFYLGSSVSFLRRVNLCLWLLSVLLTYKVTETLIGRRSAVMSTVLILAYPMLLYTAAFLYPQILGADLFLIFLYLHLRYRERSGVATAATGLVFGFLILTLPIYVFALPAFHFLIKRRAGIFRAMIVASLAILLAGLWSVRNYRQFHSIFFIATQSGHELLVGNSEHTTATAVDAEISHEATLAADLKLDEVQTDRLFRRAAIQWIAQHPARWVILYASKFLNWFNFRNDLLTKQESSTLKWTVSFVTWYSLLGLALCRVCFDIRRLSAEEICLCVVYLTCAAVYAVFYTRLRYRVPFDYIVIILAAAFCGERFRVSVKEDTEALASSGI